MRKKKFTTVNPRFKYIKLEFKEITSNRAYPNEGFWSRDRSNDTFRLSCHEESCLWLSRQGLKQTSLRSNRCLLDASKLGPFRLSGIFKHYMSYQLTGCAYCDGHTTGVASLLYREDMWNISYSIQKIYSAIESLRFFCICYPWTYKTALKL